MNIALFLDLWRDMLWMVLLLGGPVLVISLVIGVGVSIIQTLTQVQESTLTFVPKLLATMALLALLAPWMLERLINYTTGLFTRLVDVAQQVGGL